MYRLHKRDRHDLATNNIMCWALKRIGKQSSYITGSVLLICIEKHTYSLWSVTINPHVIPLVIILVNHLSSGCYNRLPLTEWLKQQTVTFYSSGGGQSEIRVPAWLGPGSVLMWPFLGACVEGEIKISLPLFIKVLTPA